MSPFGHGDRVRYSTMGDDGFPLVRYGFVGGVDNGGPIVVMFDGELGGEVVDPSEIEPVHMSNVTLVLAGSDLLDDPSLRQGLVNLFAQCLQARLGVADLFLDAQHPPVRVGVVLLGAALELVHDGDETVQADDAGPAFGGRAAVPDA